MPAVIRARIITKTAGVNDYEDMDGDGYVNPNDNTILTLQWLQSDDTYADDPGVMYPRLVSLDGPAYENEAFPLNEFGHQGLMHDETTGLIYNRARFRNHDRFLQRDPLGYPDGANPFACYHVLRESVDPTGKQFRGGRDPLDIFFSGWGFDSWFDDTVEAVNEAPEKAIKAVAKGTDVVAEKTYDGLKTAGWAFEAGMNELGVRAGIVLEELGEALTVLGSGGPYADQIATGGHPAMEYLRNAARLFDCVSLFGQDIEQLGEWIQDESAAYRDKALENLSRAIRHGGETDSVPNLSDMLDSMYNTIGDTTHNFFFGDD